MDYQCIKMDSNRVHFVRSRFSRILSLGIFISGLFLLLAGIAGLIFGTGGQLRWFLIAIGFLMLGLALLRRESSLFVPRDFLFRPAKKKFEVHCFQKQTGTFPFSQIAAFGIRFHRKYRHIALFQDIDGSTWDLTSFRIRSSAETFIKNLIEVSGWKPLKTRKIRKSNRKESLSGKSEYIEDDLEVILDETIAFRQMGPDIVFWKDIFIIKIIPAMFCFFSGAYLLIYSMMYIYTSSVADLIVLVLYLSLILLGLILTVRESFFRFGFRLKDGMLQYIRFHIGSPENIIILREMPQKEIHRIRIPFELSSYVPEIQFLSEYECQALDHLGSLAASFEAAQAKKKSFRVLLGGVDTVDLMRLQHFLKIRLGAK